MSKPRYRWWGFAKNILRDYPRLRREYENLKGSTITPNYEAIGHGSGTSRPVENVALRTLPDADDQRAYDAARLAMAAIQAEPNGEFKRRFVELVYWRKTHNQIGAALEIGISERTAKRWNHQVLMKVGRFYGFLPEKKNQNT